MIYFGFRDSNGTCHVFKVGEGLLEGLKPRLDVWNHSPTGFEWGYQGSGPAQLAVAILCDALGDTVVARSLHQEFKRDHINGWKGTGWALDREVVIKWAMVKLSDGLRERVSFVFDKEVTEHG